MRRYLTNEQEATPGKDAIACHMCIMFRIYVETEPQAEDINKMYVQMCA